MEATGRKPCRALDLFYACDLAFCLSLLAFRFSIPPKKKAFCFPAELAGWSKAVGRCAQRIVHAAKFGKLPCGQRLRPVVNRLRVVHGLLPLRAAHCPQRRLTNTCKDLFEWIHENKYMGLKAAPLQATFYGACYRLHVVNPLPITREAITDYTCFCYRLHVDNVGRFACSPWGTRLCGIVTDYTWISRVIHRVTPTAKCFL